MRILVTGAAGFIGFHLSKRFCDMGYEVVGIDNLNDYYDVSLKRARLAILQEPSPLEGEGTVRGAFTFKKIDIADRGAMEKLFNDYEFDRVVHLAAQAGVRYSIENPHVYIQSNIVGFMNVLEGCRSQWVSDSPTVHGSRHLVFASSSSVYGLNTKMPFSVRDNVDHPISLYAATKKSTELMAHAYSYLYGIPVTGLRFFTVYGPWGRPDMALFKFTKAILNGDFIDVYNEGKMWRDFTYIDDIIEGIVRVTDHIPGSHISRFYRLYNIGNHSPVELMYFIRVLEDVLGEKAKMNLLPMQPGDVQVTYADVDDLMSDVNFAPSTSIEKGIGAFVEWYKWFNEEQEHR